MSRRSYRYLMSLPVYGLYDAQGDLLGTVRAEGHVTARELFRTYNKNPTYGFSTGVRVARIP